MLERGLAGERDLPRNGASRGLTTVEQQIEDPAPLWVGNRGSQLVAERGVRTLGSTSPTAGLDGLIRASPEGYRFPLPRRSLLSPVQPRDLPRLMSLISWSLLIRGGRRINLAAGVPLHTTEGDQVSGVADLGFVNGEDIGR